MARVFLTSILILSVLFPALATAQEKTNPKEIVLGVIILNLNAQYVVLKVDGDDWEQFFFEDDGKTLIIEGINRTMEHRFTLTPIEDELRMIEQVITPKEWKLARLDRETRQWQVKKVLKFKAWKPGEKEKVIAEQNRKAEEKARKAEEEAHQAEEAARKAEEAKKETPKPDVRPEGKAIDKPEEKPVDKPTTNAVDKPVEKPVDKPEEKPIDKPTRNAVDKPTRNAVDKPVEKPVDKPTEKPTDRPAAKKDVPAPEASE